MNWLAVKARESGKELLLLNLDETSIPVQFTNGSASAHDTSVPIRHRRQVHSRQRRNELPKQAT